MYGDPVALLDCADGPLNFWDVVVLCSDVVDDWEDVVFREKIANSRLRRESAREVSRKLDIIYFI